MDLLQVAPLWYCVGRMSRSGESCLPTQKKTPSEVEIRFRDTPESKVREWVAKTSKTMDPRGRKGAYRAIVLDIWLGIFVEVMDEGSRTSRAPR